MDETTKKINEQEKAPLRKPHWLKVKMSGGESYSSVRQTVEGHALHTICQSGSCPNIGECWRAGTATFMILGNICTRSCRFCAVQTGRPLPVDETEPEKIAESIKLMKLRHAVITSVDRDDLPDGGAGIWAKTIQAVRLATPQTTIEVLVPDFKGVEKDIKTVVDARPDIISHNMETVERLTREVRVQARYRRSLSVLEMMKKLGARRTKSGIMLGLGETKEEVLQTLADMRSVSVDVVTIGQYLRPTREHLAVEEYVTPEMFDFYGEQAKKMGFLFVQSAPLVRSSYHAEMQV
ncbi:MAG: lipoyl synthase [Flavobacteriales bacterium]|nr:lipoyl synthase [Flavobacteriales bacterium]